jgi:hypothetical protein
MVAADGEQRWQKLPESETAVRAARMAAFPAIDAEVAAGFRAGGEHAIQDHGRSGRTEGGPCALRVLHPGQTRKGVETEEIEARVTALEEAAGEQGRR